MSDNIRRWMATDLTGVLALGSNGEAAARRRRKSGGRRDGARHAARARVARGRGRESTRQTIWPRARREVWRARRSRADAALQVADDGRGAERPLQAVATRRRCPCCSTTARRDGVSFTLPIVTRLADHSNVAGSRKRVRHQRSASSPACGPIVSCLGGCAGGVSRARERRPGAILAVANVLPGVLRALRSLGGRHHEALELSAS